MIYITGANFTLTKGADIEYNFMEVGYNTGNMAIARGVKDLVRKYFYADAQRYNPSAVINDNDLLVIGAANWISKSVDLEWIFYPGIERFRKILILGLGIQNDLADLYAVSASGRKFLDWIFSRNSVICTRDTQTYSLLKKYHDYVFWTGCPSLRIDCLPNSNNHVKQGLSYGGSIEVISHSTNAKILEDFENSIFADLCSQNNFNSYILQAEFPLMKALSQGDMQAFSDYLAKKLPTVKLDDSFPVNKFKYFFDIDDWIDYLSRTKLFFGTRLHGNIISWLSGGNSFLLAHDARTKAFLTDFEFPGLALDHQVEISQIIKSCREVDYTNFEKKLATSLNNLESAFSEVKYIS